MWDGDQVLVEVRTSGDSVAGGAGTSESDGASGSGAGYAGYGRVGYVHAGGIDAPLELFKESAVVVPHANWRGVYDSGTCPASACAATVQFPGGQGTAGVFGDGYNPDAVDWYGSLVWAQQDASGYQYKRNRYYDPTSGRFTQEDPIGLAGGLNLYGFAGGDPVNFSDPFGLCPWCLTGAIGAIVGAGSAAVTTVAMNAAMGRPLSEGAGTAALVGGIAGGLTGATMGLASPASAAVISYGFGLGLVEVGAALPVVKSAVDKLNGLAQKFGSTSGQIANNVLQNGRAYVDKSSGNINNLLARPDGASGFIRVTTDAASKRIVSAGYLSATQLANGVADGRFVPK